MSLLPYHASIDMQKIADVADTEGIEDYSVLTTDPLQCHYSLLEHIALGLNVSIQGMSETFARTYLKKIKNGRNIAGTVQSVEDAIDIFLGEGKLVEWFDDEGLKRGNFKVLTKNFNVSNFIKNIKYFKNVRSKLISVSDANCSLRARLDYSLQDNDLLDDVDGVSLNGVRVCFKSVDTKKILLGNIDVDKSRVRSTISSLDFFKNRFGEFIFESVQTFNTAVYLIQNTNKNLIIPRNWLGAWVGKWSDDYTVAAYSNRTSFLEQKNTKDI